MAYPTPLAVANCFAIAVNVYAAYLIVYVADKIFSKYRMLLLASTVSRG